MIKLKEAPGDKLGKWIRAMSLSPGDTVHLRCRAGSGQFPSEALVRIDVHRKADYITSYLDQRYVKSNEGETFVEAQVLACDLEGKSVRILLPGDSNPRLPLVPRGWLIRQKMRDPFDPTEDGEQS